MADEERQLTIIEQFEGSSIRKVWHQGEWWYSLVDAMSVFAGTNRARKYWYDLKKKILEEEGYLEHESWRNYSEGLCRLLKEKKSARVIS